MKNFFIGLLIFLLFLFIIFFIFSNKIKELFIKREIKKANYCQVDQDCVDAGSQCPFGCYAYVNKNEAGRISNLIKSFNSKCVYGCISCPTAKCEDGKCLEVCD